MLETLDSGSRSLAAVYIHGPTWNSLPASVHKRGVRPALFTVIAVDLIEGGVSSSTGAITRFFQEFQALRRRLLPFWLDVCSRVYVGSVCGFLAAGLPSM